MEFTKGPGKVEPSDEKEEIQKLSNFVRDLFKLDLDGFRITSGAPPNLEASDIIKTFIYISMGDRDYELKTFRLYRYGSQERLVNKIKELLDRDDFSTLIISDGEIEPDYCIFRFDDRYFYFVNTKMKLKEAPLEKIASLIYGDKFAFPPPDNVVNVTLFYFIRYPVDVSLRRLTQEGLSDSEGDLAPLDFSDRDSSSSSDEPLRERY